MTLINKQMIFLTFFEEIGIIPYFKEDFPFLLKGAGRRLSSSKHSESWTVFCLKDGSSSKIETEILWRAALGRKRLRKKR